jgi:hypothetical protein
MSDLSKKLGLRAGRSVCLLHPTPGAMGALRLVLPAEAAISSALGRAKYDLILYWPARKRRLAQDFTRLERHLGPDGALWVVMPKKGFAKARGRDFTWEDVQRAALTTDLVDNKVAAVTPEEYGTRFVIRRHLRIRGPD